MKYLKLYLCILLTMLVLTSCDKVTETLGDIDFTCNTVFDFSFKDKNGNDLLDTSFANSYKQEDFEIYSMDNGVKKNITVGNGMRFVCFYGEHALRIGLWKYDTIYLKLPVKKNYKALGTEIDTITHTRSTYHINNIVDSIWYNSKLVYHGSSTESMIKIIK